MARVNAIWSKQDLERRLKRWFLEKAAEAKKALILSIRAQGAASSIEAAVSLAEAAYEKLQAAMESGACGLYFGKAYALADPEPQMDCYVYIKCGKERRGVRLLGGIDRDGPCMIAAGDHDGKKRAREEYQRHFLLR